VSCIAYGGTHLVDPVTSQLLVPRPKLTHEIEGATEAILQRAVSSLFPLTEVRFGCR
jgi:hypothetical protein